VIVNVTGSPSGSVAPLSVISRYLWFGGQSVGASDVTVAQRGSLLTTIQVLVAVAVGSPASQAPFRSLSKHAAIVSVPAFVPV
jgi:hypothetical protein